MPIAIIPDDTFEHPIAAGARAIAQFRLNTKSSSNCSTREAYTMMMKREREREGRCADCGVQTHDIQVDTRTLKYIKVPLSIENEVHRGRCLFCYPLIRKYPGGNYSHDSRGCQLLTTDDTSERLALNTIENSCLEILDILSVMKRFSRNLQVQERGCERLWVLSWEDENSAAIGRVGGISLILTAMARFTESLHIQQCGCECLQNLALNDYNRDEICCHGGIALIQQAMNRFPLVAGIQECGCTALANIATCQANRIAIEREGGLIAILSASNLFPQRESVLLAAEDALTALGYNTGERYQSPAVIDMDM